MSGFLRGFGVAALWQALSKLIQLVGAGHAFLCLGPVRAGMSAEVIVYVGALQLMLDLGLDIIAVRRIASGRSSAKTVCQALFTLRLLLVGICSLLWLLVAGLGMSEGELRVVWMLGAGYLFSTSLGYFWYFQAAKKVPQLSMIQAGIGIGSSYLFIYFFQPGMPAGSDLLVMILVQGVLNSGAWLWIRNDADCRLIDFSAIRMALELFKEGVASWFFNLSYYGLSNLGIPFCGWLLSRYDAGQYRAAAAFVASMQLFLTYLSFMLNPKIVEWRQTVPDKLVGRCLAVVALLMVAGLLAFGATWWMREWITELIFGPEFLPSADVLPALVLGKFFAVASGVLCWAFFADHKNWWPGLCCWPPICVAVMAYHWILPKYGLSAAGWATLVGETALLLCCLFAVSRLNPTEQSFDEESS